MESYFLAPFWGQEHLHPKVFLQLVQEAGYQGVEINLPTDTSFTRAFWVEVEAIRRENPAFVVALQVVLNREESWQTELGTYSKRLAELAALQPNFINAHTGRDYFTFQQNAQFLEIASTISARTKVPIYHETHRGRFSFHAPTLVPYLQAFPNLRLTGDFSHFCVVSESMLSGQEEILAILIPHIYHLHARLGYEHGPQVNYPSGTQWMPQTTAFLQWWQRVQTERLQAGASIFSITPEFGPEPYLPTHPQSGQPFYTPWEANLWMRNFLQINGF